MGILLDIGQRTLTIYLGILAGFIFINSPLKKYRKAFVEITINVFTPFLIFISLIRLELDNNWIYPVAGALIVTILGLAIPYGLTKFMKLEEPDPAELCTSTFPNALNFPFPIIFAFAPEGLGLAGIFLAVNVILRNTLGFRISGVKINRESLRLIYTFTPIWAIIFGGILRLVAIDQVGFISDLAITDILFQVGIYMTLMTVGFGLKKPDWSFKIPIFRVSMTRYVVSGILGFLIIILFGAPQYAAVPFVVQLMAPPAVYNGLYAEKFGLNTELTSQIIVTLTMIALIILPAELLVLELMF